MEYSVKIFSKQCLLFISTFFFSFALFSQTERQRGYVGISFGPSIPIGHFESKNFQNEKAGLATTGTAFDFFGAYRLAKNFGIIIEFLNQTNPIDVNVVSNEIKKAYPNPNIKWDVHANDWRIRGFMGGVYGSFPMYSQTKTIFEIKAMVGFLNATSPFMKITGSQGSNSVWTEMESASAKSIVATILGAGFRFNLSEQFGLNIMADYLNTKPEFINVKNTSSLGTTLLINISQEIQTFSIGFGMVYRLK